MNVTEFDHIARSRDGPARLLLDARNSVEAGRWRPEGPGISSYLNIPYFEFIEDEGTAIARVPRGADVMVLCAKGGSSGYIAELLRSNGISASNIEGGMLAWAAHHRIERINPHSDSFALYQIIRPSKGCLSYAIVSGDEALIVDCSRHAETYEEFAALHGARIVCIVDTHLHADHVSGAVHLARRSNASYLLSEEDAGGALVPRSPIPRRLRIGNVPVDVMALPVPGHTMGSTALLVDKRYLISGDTLLPEGVGRPDLGNKAREWTQHLYDSLTMVLQRLDPRTIVLPAHVSNANQYDASGTCARSLGDLLAAQPLTDRAAFVERTAEMAQAAVQPPEYARIRRVNLGEPAPPEDIETLEIGVNRCALAASGA